MYEIYYYAPTDFRRAYYNIRDTNNNSTTGSYSSINKALSASYHVNDEVLSVHDFEHGYKCKLLFTTPTLTNLIDNYPEYFI